MPVRSGEGKTRKFTIEIRTHHETISMKGALDRLFEEQIAGVLGAIGFGYWVLTVKEV